MKPFSAYYGRPNEIVEEKTAWRPIQTTSQKTIWPGQKYVVVRKFYDGQTYPFKKASWKFIYTPKEYTVYLLTKNPKEEKEDFLKERQRVAKDYMKKYQHMFKKKTNK